MRSPSQIVSSEATKETIGRGLTVILKYLVVGVHCNCEESIIVTDIVVSAVGAIENREFFKESLLFQMIEQLLVTVFILKIDRIVSDPKQMVGSEDLSKDTAPHGTTHVNIVDVSLVPQGSLPIAITFIVAESPKEKVPVTVWVSPELPELGIENTPPSTLTK